MTFKSFKIKRVCSFCVCIVANIKDEILLKRIALTIKEIRSNCGITLDDFYIDTGIHLGRIEQGKTNLTVSTLKCICSYFNITLVDFFLRLENV